MFGDLIQIFAVTITVYTLVPTILARFCGLGVISRLTLKDRVIITFDDGPDPLYTPRVLDILRAAGVKACFFVIGEKARRHPELIEKMVSDGHEVGNHGLRHSVPWLLGPLGTFREMKESSRIIEEITGSPPAAFRPPWGLLNLSSYFSRFLIRHKVVLWSFMSWDWTRGATTENIKTKVRKNRIDGSILIFHDSDTEPGASTGSPEKMISALPGIISELKERGYRITLLGDCIQQCRPRPNTWLLGIWRMWDKFFRLALNIRDVTGNYGKPTIFRTSVRRYPGPGVDLPGGEALSPGEKICEIHINNDHLAGLLKGENSPGKIGIMVARELHRSLPVLALKINKDPQFRDVRYLVGITMLHRGTASMGFTPVEIPSSRARKIISCYQRLVLKLYHPSGRGRLHGKGDMTPKIIVMSKTALLSKYLES